MKGGMTDMHAISTGAARVHKQMGGGGSSSYCIHPQQLQPSPIPQQPPPAHLVDALQRGAALCHHRDSCHGGRHRVAGKAGERLGVHLLRHAVVHQGCKDGALGGLQGRRGAQQEAAGHLDAVNLGQAAGGADGEGVGAPGGAEAHAGAHLQGGGGGDGRQGAARQQGAAAEGTTGSAWWHAVHAHKWQCRQRQDAGACVQRGLWLRRYFQTVVLSGNQIYYQ